MPLLVSTGLGLLVREFRKRVTPNKTTPALTRGLFTATKRNVVRRRRVIQSDPFSDENLKQRMGGYCVRRYCSAVSNSESENWVPVYRFKKIPFYSGIARAKFLQTIFSVLLVPYQSYAFYNEAITLNSYLASLAFAAVAPFVLIGFTRYFNRIIGVVAYEEEQNLVRFGYLGFWGGRKNLIVSMDDVLPLTDTHDLDRVKAVIRLDLKQHGYLLLSLRDCEIVDEEIAKEIFGNLKYFEKFE